MGVEDSTLQAIQVPVLIIPGNDRTHAREYAIAAAQIIPQVELFQLPIEDQDADIISFTQWAPLEDAIATKIISFLKGIPE